MPASPSLPSVHWSSARQRPTQPPPLGFLFLFFSSRRPTSFSLPPISPHQTKTNTNSQPLIAAPPSLTHPSPGQDQRTKGAATVPPSASLSRSTDRPSSASATDLSFLPSSPSSSPPPSSGVSASNRHQPPSQETQLSPHSAATTHSPGPTASL